MSLLRMLNQAGVLRTIDDALANTLRRLDPDTPDEVLAAAALASLAVAQGHAGLDLSQSRQLIDADVAWPDPDTWMQALQASRWVDTPDTTDHEAAAVPLVFEHGLLYLRRYREYERRLALQLRRIAAQPLPATEIEPVAPLFATLFPGGTARLPSAGEGIERSPTSSTSPVHGRGRTEDAAGGARVPDHQARAAALALRRTLLLVTGGPGTGKTTTIARLLVLRIALAMHAGNLPLRIALAAPTGRAAERMAESLRRATQQMTEAGVDADLLAALPTEASTLHRLLGNMADVPRFRHHADNPLPFDVVVVDEASMIDLPLMCKLTEAVAEGTQLVLLGDAHQLPSVEAGDVLAAILTAAGAGDALAASDAAALHPLLGSVQVDTDHPANGLHGHRVHLQRGWRQSETLDLAPLAATVREGDANQALSLLRGGTLSNIHFHDGVDDPLQARPQLLEHWRALATISDPAEALQRANQLRVLTALRDGPQGARGLNARIEAALSGRRIGTSQAWFLGRLLLVTQNHYRHRLFNGDVGICLPDEDGILLAWFPGVAAGDSVSDTGHAVRAFHPAALPAHESAFATTVHKAQGSEFDEVWLQLPRTDSRVLSRELLYTGLTRARNILHVAGSAAVIDAALSRHVSRVSGLAWRLES